VRAQREGDRWRLGLLRKTRDDERVIDIPECPVHAPEVRARLATLAQAVPGDWPLHAVVAAGDFLTLVLKTAQAPVDVAAFAAGPDWAALGVRGVFLNLHPSAGNRVLGQKGWLRLWGEDRADEDGLFYGPSAFQQLIPELHGAALDRAERFLAPGPDRAVADLCSGTGRSLARWRAAGADALGVELSGEAVECAERAGLRCLRGKASERIPQLREWLAGRDWAAFANPPRLGLEPEVVHWLAEDRPARLAYLSCSAGTLARDLAALGQSGFEVEAIFPYDFFPQTSHVETLALLKAPE
jgi:tRNA/tmRNA/rRNA uracil-C5-methylase (TrmA/RlmC/RlmD family)